MIKKSLCAFAILLALCSCQREKMVTLHDYTVRLYYIDGSTQIVSFNSMSCLPKLNVDRGTCWIYFHNKVDTITGELSNAGFIYNVSRYEVLKDKTYPYKIELW